MDLRDWIDERGGIVHRQDVLDAGLSARRLREELRSGPVRRERRYWLATPTAPHPLVAAARATARLGCVSAARHRGWWIPPDADGSIHLAVKPHAERPDGAFVVHWSTPLVPLPANRLVESVEDSLEHIAECLPREQALVLWESGARAEAIAPETIGQVRWRSAAAREIAAALTGRSDSGLETIVVVRLSPWGLKIRQQAVIAGHAVDILIGERLIVQLDGYAFHSSPKDRARDVAHDRELVTRGYTVLRFTYAEVIYDWPRVEQVIARAIAQGRHLAR